MQKYFGLTNKEEVIYLGKFASFYNAWEETNDLAGVNYVWIFSEENLEKVFGHIENLLRDS